MKILPWTNQNLLALRHSRECGNPDWTFLEWRSYAGRAGRPRSQRGQVKHALRVESVRSASEALDGCGSTDTAGTTTASLPRTLQGQKSEVVRLLTPAKEDRDIITAGSDDISRRHSTPLTRQPHQPLRAIFNT